MDTLKVKNADALDKYLGGFGAGTTASPFFPLNLPASIVIPLAGLTSIRGLNVNGRNGDVDTGGSEMITSRGNITFPTIARVHDIASSDAADTAAGTGARTVLVEGLDSSWDEISETVILNGVANVPTSNAYIRINKMTVITSGTGNTNAGTITATAQTDATVTAEIPVGTGETAQAIYSVPNGHKFLITNIFTSMSRPAAASNSVAEMVLRITISADSADATILNEHDYDVSIEGSSDYKHFFGVAKIINAKSDVIIQCNTVSDNNSVISAGFDGYVVAV